MVGPRVLTLQPPGHDLAVVVRQMGEAADARDIAGPVDAVPRLEGFGVDLQPASVRLGETGELPGLEVGSPAGRDQ